MVSIRLRNSTDRSAQRLILQSQFETFYPELLDSVIDGFSGLTTQELWPGLQHRCTKVLLATLKILLDRRVIDDPTLDRFLDHRDAAVRLEAIKALTSCARSFSRDEVKDILLKKDESDRAGRVHYDRYIYDDLLGLNESQLSTMVNTSKIYDDVAYFARAERFFKKYGSKLRDDIDEKFQTYFQNLVARMASSFSPHNPVEFQKLFEDLEDDYRKQLTRTALDILCDARDKEDLERIRSNLSEGYAGPSSGDAVYIAKNGEWKDISLITSLGVFFHRGIRASRRKRDDFDRKVAKAALSISRRHSVSKLFGADMTESILTTVVNLCPDSRFLSISNEALHRLIHHESYRVRRATAIKAVSVFSAKRIRLVLKQYISADKFYYNVVHWLDVGASLPRKKARRVAQNTAEQ